MFVSDYFQLDDHQFELMCSMGVFDALLNKDNHLFINIIRLKQSTIPEFVKAYQRINNYFGNIATLLDAADKPIMADIMYRAARNIFCFHEVNGINLGFSESGHGSGWGDKLSKRVLQDAYQIVKKGSKQPEIFHLVSLFEEDIGPDRLSDMIATIIEQEIIEYSLRIMKELNVTPETRPELLFLENGLVENPNKRNTAILLLPTEVLHELPIAKDWEDIDKVVLENSIIRQEISAEIGERWAKWALADKKMYLKENVFMDPNVCSRVIDGYRSIEIEEYNIKADLKYFTELLLKIFKRFDSFKQKAEYPTSLAATLYIVGILKDWVENNRGWAEIQNAPTNKREKAVQRFMHLAAKSYVEQHDLDFTCESDAGRGPADIKLSRGTDKTVVEIKLSSNGQYIHGFQEQIKEYGLAERTMNLVYVFIDIGNPIRRKKLVSLFNKTRQSVELCPELIIIDARPKEAASTYNCSSDGYELVADISFDDMPEIDFDSSLLVDWDNNE